MCTAISLMKTKHYFGRTLDLDTSYGEEVIITPRNFDFHFRDKKIGDSHFAIIGMGTVIDGYPLYYDAANERGLCIAALNFPLSAKFSKVRKKGNFNVATFELIPFILRNCTNTEEAKDIMLNANITNESFNSKVPAATLHWIISDRNRSITIESMSDGIHIYDNDIDVLTNEPRFDFQKYNLYRYIGLSASEAEKRFADNICFTTYSKGMGAIGLPGDLSSPSRFVRAAFHRHNGISDTNDEICLFFHILGTVEIPKGSVIQSDGKYHFTVYTSCIDADAGIYYYTTYKNTQISAVDLKKERLSKVELIRYPIRYEGDIYKHQ